MAHSITTQLLAKYEPLTTSAINSLMAMIVRRMEFENFQDLFKSWIFGDQLGMFKVFHFIKSIWVKHGADEFSILWMVRDTTKEERDLEAKEFKDNNVPLSNMRKSILHIEDKDGTFIELDVYPCEKIENYILRWNDTTEKDYCRSLEQMNREAHEYGPGIVIFTTDPYGNEIPIKQGMTEDTPGQLRGKNL